jgi:uncharacterized membrane protein YeaQ/YmgE (transglycosylase-associated protein family)
MDFMSLIIQIISGAAGGIIAGNILVRKQSLGPFGDTLAGVVGGGLVGMLGIAQAAGPANADNRSLLIQVATCAIGGAIAMMITTGVKQAMGK